MTHAERQKLVRSRIEEVEADFYAPLLGLTMLNLFPERFSDDEIVDGVLSAYKQMEIDLSAYEGQEPKE